MRAIGDQDPISAERRRERREPYPRDRRKTDVRVSTGVDLAAFTPRP